MLDGLPGISQSELVREVAPRLWAGEGVVALWVAGSLATGTADRYSDVDLHLAVESEAMDGWQEPDLEALFAGRCRSRQFSRFGDDFYVHHLLLDGGEVIDLHVQSTERKPFPAPRLLLGCRDPELRATLEQPLEPERHYVLSIDPWIARQILELYWFDAHKHRKVLSRDLDLLLLVGLHLQRLWALRFCYMHATGEDCTDLRRVTIHTLTPIVRAVQQAAGPEVQRALGMPARTRAEVLAAVDALHALVARIGRELAARHGFDYPAELEALVLESWEAFKAEHGSV